MAMATAARQDVINVATSAHLDTFVSILHRTTGHHPAAPGSASLLGGHGSIAEMKAVKILLVAASCERILKRRLNLSS